MVIMLFLGDVYEKICYACNANCINPVFDIL